MTMIANITLGDVSDTAIIVHLIQSGVITRIFINIHTQSRTHIPTHIPARTHIYISKAVMYAFCDLHY